MTDTLTTAGTLSRQLAAIRDDLDRDLTAAAALRILAESLDGDAQRAVLDAAGDITGDVFDRVDRITTEGGPTRQWYIDHSDGYWRACDLMREEVMRKARAANVPNLLREQAA